ncbi:MAG: hypothetical protein AMXMBFR36_38560 [Acidobacteriota bacterium]
MLTNTTSTSQAVARPGAATPPHRAKRSAPAARGHKIHSAAAFERRRATLRLYPSVTQEKQLLTFLRLHCELYNAALEERREAWRVARKSLTFFDQVLEVPALRKLRPDIIPLNAQAIQQTLKRVALAYQAFFRRVRTGNGPAGFPRFRAWRDFPGWTYTQTGWRWTPRQDGKHGRLELANVGSIRVRGGARTLGRMKTCTILRRAGKWYASIVLECHPERRGGSEALGLDWGVAHFATLSDGSTIENPRLLERDLEKLAAAQQVVARKRKGSRRRAKAKLAVHRLHEKIRNRRTNFLHQVSADLVARASFLATEKLATKNLTRSAAGTVEEPGTHVAQKAGLNRAILDTAPATLLALLRYKAQEAGVPFVEVDTKTVKPSQRCPSCGAVAKKELSERVHRCSCGAELPRDQAAALVCLGVALTGDSRGAWPPASLRSAGGRLRSETTACGGQGRGAAAPGGEVGSPPPPVCLRNHAMLPLSPGDVANDEDDELLEEDA